MTDAEWNHCRIWVNIIAHNYASGAGTCVSEENAEKGERAGAAIIAEVERLRAALENSETHFGERLTAWVKEMETLKADLAHARHSANREYVWSMQSVWGGPEVGTASDGWHVGKPVEGE